MALAVPLARFALPVGGGSAFYVSLLRAMHRLITLLLLLAVLVPGIAHAKRKAPPKVAPVVYGGVRYTSPNDDGRRAYVQAWDANTNKMLWEVTVFHNRIDPVEEEDVQHVYIKKMSIEDGKLILVAEDERAYSLDLKTRAVKRLRADDIIVWRNVAIIPCIVAVLWFLAVVLCREWVKSDLRDRVCQPVSVRWRAFFSTHRTCAFKVIYSDLRGQIHRATCRTVWLRRDVTWFDDEIIGDTHETAV